MRDSKAKLIGFSPKIKRMKPWKEPVDVDKYQSDEQQFIKVYLTNHDMEHDHFIIDNGFIALGDEVYQIVDVTYDLKRPKYANCLVSKIAV